MKNFSDIKFRFNYKNIIKTKNFVLVRYIIVVLLIAKQKTKNKSLI